MTSSAAGSTAKRRIRDVTEREIALGLVLEFAESNMLRFSLLGFYDNDIEFIAALAERLNLAEDKSLRNKLRKVVRCLVRYGVLEGRMFGTGREYIGEPAKQMDYRLKPGKAALIRRGKTEYTWAPEEEAAYLLRHAYPAPDQD